MKFIKKIDSPALFLIMLIVFFSGCKPRVRVLKSPPHYNFSDVKEFKLDLKIREISGLVWDKANKTFIANNDEKGILFFLDKDLPETITSYTDFGPKGDYEDLAIADSTVYILKSKGVIAKFIKDSAGNASAIEYDLGLGGFNDFETMYYDDTRRSLVLVCKNCSTDDKTTISAFAFNIDSARFDNKPLYTISADAIKTMAPVKSSKFQPSAAAIHPVLKKLFIISSASNQLVIADLDGVPESVYHLSKKLFPQPEGLTFKGSGEMFISNEAVTSKATILRFAYKP